MYNKYWNVLVVDDELDVITVTKLALKRVSLYGLPVKIHACESKAAAIEWFKTSPEAKSLQLALIDVVMETKHAGLELIEWIRLEEKNRLARLVLRTGQPGNAVEREVVDNFDITAYLAKTEATEEKLYSTAKCCIKEAYVSLTLALSGQIISFLSGHTGNREMFLARMKELFKFLGSDADGKPVPSLSPHFAMFWGDQDEHVGSGVFEDRKQAIEVRDRLIAQPMTTVNEAGDTFIIAEDPVTKGERLKALLINLPASADGRFPKQQTLVCTATSPMADFAVSAMHNRQQAIRPLYMLANS